MRNLLKKLETPLFDDSTEGLDANTANAVLHTIRTHLPDALIIAAMHKGADHLIFDRAVRPPSICFCDEVTVKLMKRNHKCRETISV